MTAAPEAGKEIRPLVALIHATAPAMSPASAGFAIAYPEADLWNVLDDRLISDAIDTGVTSSLRARMLRLIDHVARSGADAVLMTCSMYGSVRPLAEAVNSIPVVAADDALFDAVRTSSPRRGLVVGSLESAVVDSLARFHASAEEHGSSVRLDGHVVTTTGSRDDAETLATNIVTSLRERDNERGEEPPDLLILAQYSLMPAARAVAAARGVPVLSGPELSAKLLRSRLQELPTPRTRR